MVMMIVEVLNIDVSKVDGELTFNDQNKIISQAAFRFVVQNGISKDNLFAPEQTDSRAQAAVVIYSLMEYQGRLKRF